MEKVAAAASSASPSWISPRRSIPASSRISPSPLPLPLPLQPPPPPPSPSSFGSKPTSRRRWELKHRRRLLRLAASYRWGNDEDDDDDGEEGRIHGGAGDGFDRGVRLFNGGEYYECHDVLESLWHTSPEPQRSVLHAILQCSVGLYHLSNQNHRGAMTELGEGLAKLRKQRFTTGPFQQFEREMSQVLEYIYNTQLEHAACSEDLCITMDGSERSYQLLGNFASGKHLYELRKAEDGISIIFIASEMADPLKVKVPVLTMTSADLRNLK